MAEIVNGNRKLQLEQLKILQEFVAVCEKLNLRYYLYAGTLLGAVRHGGFIPWDDDIDVAMPRTDYERFLKEAQPLLPEHLFLQTIETDPEYLLPFAKLRNSKTAFVETAVAHRKINHGIFMDIFPLDGYREKLVNSFGWKFKEQMIEWRISYGLRPETLRQRTKMLRWVSKFYYPSVQTACRAKVKLHRYPDESDRVAVYCDKYRKVAIPVNWYGDGAELPFEGISVKVPVQYHQVLTGVFGDYMRLPPVEQRVTEHTTTVIDTEKSYLEYI